LDYDKKSEVENKDSKVRTCSAYVTCYHTRYAWSSCHFATPYLT